MLSTDPTNAAPTATVDKKKIVILGAGFGGVYTFLRLHQIYHHDPAVSISIINRDNYFLFTPLLHEVATGGVAQDNIIYNIRSLLDCCLARFIKAEVLEVDLESKEVHTDKGAIAYDVLVHALGADTNFFELDEQSRSRTFTLKKLADAKSIKNKIVDLFEDGPEAISIVVAGGGPTGVELSAELSELLEDLTTLFPERNEDDISLHLIHGETRLLSAFHTDLGDKARRVLDKKGVEVILKDPIVSIEEDTVTTKSGRRVAATMVIWTAGVKPNKISYLPELRTDKRGRIDVSEFLSVPERPEIFVVGDAAAIPGMPMTAQGATASATAAADNIYYFLENKLQRRFVYEHKGDLFSLGQWMAGAELYRIRFFGHFAWWLWRTIYLSKVVGTRNKLKVAFDWTINLFMPRDLNRY